MSWWCQVDREEFAREIATRFEVNKADKATRGYRWSEKSTAERSRRGGQAAVRVGAHLKTEE